MAALDAAIHENTVVPSKALIQDIYPHRRPMAEPGGVDGRREAGHDSFDRPINRYRYKSKMLRTENRPYA